MRDHSSEVNWAALKTNCCYRYNTVISFTVSANCGSFIFYNTAVLYLFESNQNQTHNAPNSTVITSKILTLHRFNCHPSRWTCISQLTLSITSTVKTLIFEIESITLFWHPYFRVFACWTKQYTKIARDFKYSRPFIFAMSPRSWNKVQT